MNEQWHQQNYVMEWTLTIDDILEVFEATLCILSNIFGSVGVANSILRDFRVLGVQKFGNWENGQNMRNMQNDCVKSLILLKGHANPWKSATPPSIRVTCQIWTNRRRMILFKSKLFLSLAPFPFSRSPCRQRRRVFVVEKKKRNSGRKLYQVETIIIQKWRGTLEQLCLNNA